MKHFPQEFKRYTAMSDLPNEYRQAFGDFLTHSPVNMFGVYGVFIVKLVACLYVIITMTF